MYAISVILHENYLLAIVGEDVAIHWAGQNCLPSLAVEAPVALQSELSLHLISALKRNSQLQLQPKEPTIQTFWLATMLLQSTSKFLSGLLNKEAPLKGKTLHGLQHHSVQGNLENFPHCNP